MIPIRLEEVDDVDEVAPVCGHEVPRQQLHVRILMVQWLWSLMPYTATEKRRLQPSDREDHRGTVEALQVTLEVSRLPAW